MKLPRELSILVRTDNKTTVSVINKFGSKSPQVNKFAIALWTKVWERNVSLSALHIAGELNVVADKLSRKEIIKTEWQLSHNSFHALVSRVGSLQVDLFATPINNKLKDFVSPFPHPRAIAVDAFSLDWNRYNHIYLFPPPNAITRVLRKLRRYKGHGVLIVQFRPAAPWFPSLRRKCEPLPLELEVFQTVQGTKTFYSQQRFVPWTVYTF